MGFNQEVKDMGLKKSIIAVDDSGIMLQTLEGMLGEQYEFRGFSRAARALKYIAQSPPALILLDIDMPEVDGYAMLEILKQNIELRFVPVIFLTSNNDRNYVIKAVKYGADDYVVKPIDKDTLMNKIEALLSK